MPHNVTPTPATVGDEECDGAGATPDKGRLIEEVVSQIGADQSAENQAAPKMGPEVVRIRRSIVVWFHDFQKRVNGGRRAKGWGGHGTRRCQRCRPAGIRCSAWRQRRHTSSNKSFQTSKFPPSVMSQERNFVVPACLKK